MPAVLETQKIIPAPHAAQNGSGHAATFLTPDEYIALERRTGEKYEYRDGKVIAVAGASFDHNKIAVNIARILVNQIESLDLNCDVLNSDQRIFIRENRYVYADVSMVCGDAVLDSRDTLKNPVLIVEVLSESTQLFDFRDKFLECQQISALRHYILVEQNRVGVMHFEKLMSGLWALVGQHGALEDQIVLTADAKEIQISLADIYRRVPLEPAQSPVI